MPVVSGAVRESSVQSDAEFERIVRRHEREVRAFLAGMGVALDAVDDLAQQVFVDFYLQQSPPPDDVLAWLKGMARNQARAWIRRQGRQRRLLHHYAHHLQQCEDRESGHEHALDQLERCLDRLPDHEQSLLRRYYGSDECSASLAQRIGVGVSALRMSLLRLRRVLRRCIDRGLGGVS